MWRFAAAAGAVVVTLLILLVVLLVFRPTLNLTTFKSAIEGPLTAFMERPVTVEGFWLKPGSWARIRLTGLSIEAAGNDPDGVFAHAPEVELELAVVPLLKSQIRLRALTARGFDFDIRQYADGTGNWPVWTTFTYEIVDLLGIDFENTAIHLLDEESDQHHEVVLDRLLSGIARETPLTIDLQGRLNGEPLSHTLTGPSFADLNGDSMWPLAGELRLATTRLNLEGTAGSAEEVPIFDIEYMIHSDEFGELAVAVGAESMEIGSLDLAGHVAGAGDTYTLSGLTGTLGDTEIKGTATLDLTSDIPAVEGGFAIGHLDVLPWVGNTDSNAGMVPDEKTGLENLLPALNAVNAHLVVAINRLSLPKTDLENLEIEIDIEDGVLSVPIELSVGPSAVRGLFEVEEDDGQPRFALNLDTQSFDLGVFGREEIDGTVGQFSVEAESRGSAIGELGKSLQFRVRGNSLAVTIQDADDGVFEIPIRSVAVVQNPGTGVWATARGRHKDTPFTIEVATANLMKLLDGVTLPVNIAARGSGATATVRGRVRPTSTAPGVNLRFGVEGDAIGALSPWTGLSPDAAVPYLVKGRLDTMHGPPRMVIEDGRIGRSSASASLSMTGGDHVIVARIDAPLIDLEELATILPSTEAMAPEDGMSIYEKIIPTQVSLPDADVEILVGRVRHGDLDLDDISASLRSREGHLETSPFEFKWEEQPISGQLHIDLRSDRPEIDLFVSSRHLDEEDIEHGLDLESLPETSIGRVGIDFELRGSTLDELYFDSYASIVVDDLRALISNPISEDEWNIAISHLQADALYGEPTRIAAAGFINGAPVDFLMNYAMADLETHARDGLPVHVVLRSKDTELDIEGNLVLPIDPKNLEFHVLLHGASLDDLNPMLGTDLPSLGPYSVDGRFTAAERNFDLSNLFIVVGDSTLQGNLGYFEEEERPIIVGRLASHRPRLEDFYLAPEDEDKRPAGAPQTSGTDGHESVLDPELLRLVDLDLSFDVTGFEWGDRGPGTGEFRLQLNDGSLVTTVRWDQPQGGYINARLDLESNGEVFDATLDADIDHMSYGPLRPLLEWEGGQGGLLSLDTRLSGSGSTLEELLISSEGHLDFTTYPEGHYDALFNLWGGQLIDTLLPIFGAEKTQSELNCTVGELDFVNGRIVPRKLILDVSRSRVRGKGEIDLLNNTINLKLSPRPKRRGFISLATPININGPLDGPNIGVDTGGFALTVFRVSMFVWTVWLELFKKQLPADGSDICVDPIPRALEGRPRQGNQGVTAGS